jgi:uncharacterized SAM-binding protein YcdF (DUF218 family)
VQLTLVAFGLLSALLATSAVARRVAPTSNTARQRFDAIIVLGTPADRDGNPTPDQLSRLTEGVREYERGVAPRLILSGGAAHNRFTEASVMARSAQAMGIPASAIFQETEAMDTFQNACFSERIMKAHGWKSAEVVSRAEHLPRAGYIFDRMPLLWSAHAAPALRPESPAYLHAVSAVETMKTARYLLWARWVETCEP